MRNDPAGPPARSPGDTHGQPGIGDSQSPGGRPFRIRSSHHLEILAEQLAERMRHAPPEPLEPERIVVPDPLIGQWLQLRIASRLGVAAHLRIEQPAEFAWTTMRSELDGLADRSVYGPPYLRWRIFDRLERWEGEDEVSRYLADGDPRKRFELADRLARAYDRCRIFRPQSIRDWQRGGSGEWHARLWADLAAGDTKPRHWVDAIDRFRQALASRTAAATRPRISFFHVTGLSPTYVEFLRLASAVMDLELYLWRPTHRFWSHPAPKQAGGYYDEDCELVEAWGRSARDQQYLLRSASANANANANLDDDDAATDGPTGDTRLHWLHRDILGAAVAPQSMDASNDPSWNARGGASASGETVAGPARAGAAVAPDDSLQVHVCHSPTREVEVLHDRLLGLFAAHEDIEPADVLILTPEIDTYAPLIEAVFGAADDAIPFDIGRQRLKEGAALTAFLDLLDLPGSRYAATTVLAPLAAEVVRGRFGIDGPGLELVRDAVTRAAVRWGLDGDHQGTLETPAPPNHNWRHGLRRLLLGYAMEEGDTLVEGATPSSLDRWGFHTGANDYELFGRFARYAELAFNFEDTAGGERTAAEWAELLRTNVLDRFFVDPTTLASDGAREVYTVDRLIEEFANECDDAGAEGPVPFAVIRDVLRQQAVKASRATPRLAEGVTVSDLASGRIFPARVVCAIGLNDRTFPRGQGAAPFGFLAELFDGEAHRPGDRLRRDEDRLAFLEAVLSARDSFIVTYTGRDLQEGGPIPPSVVLSELLSHLAAKLAVAEAGGRPKHGQASRFETVHPLQPFSPRYFPRTDRTSGDTDADLWSYSQPMADTAAASGESGGPPDRFEGELDTEAADRAVDEIELEELIRFAYSPSKHFAANRLGLKLDRRRDELADDEPLALDNLQSWQLKDSLSRREGQEAERSAAWSEASGFLPPGNLGKMEQQRIAAEWEELAKALEPYAEHRNARPRILDLDLGKHRVVGAVERFHEQRGELLWWRVGGIRPKDELEVWLRLLTLTCATGQPLTAKVFGLRGEVVKETITGPPPEQARSHLVAWLENWETGRNRPLPFFATTSREWLEKAPPEPVADSSASGAAQTGNGAARRATDGPLPGAPASPTASQGSPPPNPRPDDKANDAALKAWTSDYGEGSDACHALIFGDDPTGEEFETLARKLLSPLVGAKR